MNTVDALKDLYKTLCGKDYAGDPNPTDAEMISAIAKDASTWGGGENNISIVIHCTDIDDYSTYTVDPISENLSADDLFNAKVYRYIHNNMFGTVILKRIDSVLTVTADNVGIDGVPTLYTITPAARPVELIVDEGDPYYIELVYDIASGEIEILSTDDNL